MDRQEMSNRSRGPAKDLLKKVPSKFDKYFIDKELQHIDNL
jgi:hypothetical protein